MSRIEVGALNEKLAPKYLEPLSIHQFPTFLSAGIREEEFHNFGDTALDLKRMSRCQVHVSHWKTFGGHLEFLSMHDIYIHAQIREPVESRRTYA